MARDYAAEYARRKARGLARGQTVQQARGHATPQGKSEYQVRKERRVHREVMDYLGAYRYRHEDPEQMLRLGVRHFGSEARLLKVLDAQEQAEAAWRRSRLPSSGSVEAVWNANRVVGKTLSHHDITHFGYVRPYSVFSYYH